MFTRQDFLHLELMTDSDLRQEIKSAEDYYIEVQEAFREYEEEALEELPFENALLSVSVLTSKLANIESYIAKAEGLINDELGVHVLPLKTFRKRKKNGNKRPRIKLAL